MITADIDEVPILVPAIIRIHSYVNVRYRLDGVH